MSTTPVSVAASAWTGVTVRISRLRARLITAESTATQLSRSLMIGLVVRASSSISSSLSSSPCNESCHSKPNSACGPKRPSCRGSSRVPAGDRRPSSTRWVTSRSRYFGHMTGWPASVSAAAPPSRSERISSESRVISSGTRRSSNRSRTGQASAAERSAMAAWVRARSPKPWAASGPDSAHSSEASAR